jgi:hypothetical protein
MNVYRHVTPLIVILLLTVLFVGVVTIHPTTGKAAPVLHAGGALKYKGITYFGYADEYDSPGSNVSLNALKSTGANYVAVTVMQYLSNSTSNTIFPDPNQTESDASVIDAINEIHARGMGVMLKPMLDSTNRSFGQGDLTTTNPAAWFASYSTFINHYAQIAQKNHVELFCVGCELDHLDTRIYDANWRTVISGVRAIYKGPLTYAANWWRYRGVPFWNALDYIGIDAYFPLSTAQTPAEVDLVGAWSGYFSTISLDIGYHNWLQEIEAQQACVGKPVLFTEIGYRSCDYTAKNPGDWDKTAVYNASGQTNCYEAALQVFANKPWFAGMFWWSWQPNPKAGGAGDTDYTPQNKPAQNVLTADWLP